MEEIRPNICSCQYIIDFQQIFHKKLLRVFIKNNFGKSMILIIQHDCLIFFALFRVYWDMSLWLSRDKNL